IATSDVVAPGIGFPAPGRIFHNSAYRWAATNDGLRAVASADDDARWRALDQDWYRGGQRYRDLDLLARRKSSVFRRWLNHPSYDRYWQKMIPFQEQFAAINIPVLSMSGYYGSGGADSLYYFTEHDRYRPGADHTLLLGA